MSAERESHNTAPLQDLPAKKAETRRNFTGIRLLEPAAAGDLKRRVDLLRQDLGSIQERAENSPFLEIGGGSGVRSLALAGEFKAQGVLTDISQNSLRNAPYAALVLQTEPIPRRICCDAHFLPFLPDTFRFVFAYRTLHHSSNLVPVVAECYRVLACEGHFFFNDEPLDSPLRRLLRSGRRLSNPPTKTQRIAARLGLHKVFWDDGAWEVSVGITEARFNRWLWLAALSPFERVDLTVNRKLKLHTNLRTPRLTAWLAGWVGGNVRGLCQKQSGKPVEGPFDQRLMCLDCGASCLTQLPDGSLQCGACARKYPHIEGITRMLPLEIENALYGEI
jgi:SAM-dependent methyltransferase